ncbi:cornifelin homolog B-like [Engraulis encrasicolus]|uniref:cornifelin homolog B-like n=1 Tax=Engraulis encrasicolus TaxID=184585 RepID=UPI002FCE6E7B
MESLPLQVKVVQSQPQAVVKEGQWSTGLFDCTEDMGDCCFATCCLPIFACKTAGAAGVCVCLPVLDCVGCLTPGSLAMRAAVRERYGIQGSLCSDCVYGCCCYPFSWCQISREIKRRAAAMANSSSSSASSSSQTSSSARYKPLLSLSEAHLI